jgi:hypothetical protein
MGEREPHRETIGRGELFCLYHPHTADTFSGYGLAIMPNRPDLLVGLLMVDRPNPADPAWLKDIEEAYGAYQLVPMTADGDLGLICQMHIHPDSRHLLRRLPTPLSQMLQEPLQPLLEELPAPTLNLHWDEESRLWRSEFAVPNELPPEIREVFERSGYGCLAVESNRGIVHICHAPDRDTDGFRGRPVHANWQLIEMPTASLIRLELVVVDNPFDPFRFESFLNVGERDQLQVLTQLASQKELHLAFYGDDLNYRSTTTTRHNEQQWQQLDEMIISALATWQQLPPEQRDYDLAKATFMARYP